MNDLCTWDSKSEKPSALDDWQAFTGLQDKNGTDIYEGDILTWMNSSVMIRGEVKFACGQFQVIPDDEIPFYFAPYAHLTEVIGNIYENPELIK